MQGEVGRITPSTRLAEFSEATPRRCRCGLPSLPPPSQACRCALWPFGHTQDRFASHIRMVGLGIPRSLHQAKAKKKNVSIAPTGRQRCIAMHRIDSSCLVTCTAGEDSQKKKSNGPKFILRPAKITVAFTACQRHTAPSDPWVDCRDETRSRLRLRQTSDAVARATPCLHFNLPAMSASPTGQSVQSFHARDRSVQS